MVRLSCSLVFFNIPSFCHFNLFSRCIVQIFSYTDFMFSIKLVNFGLACCFPQYIHLNWLISLSYGFQLSVLPWLLHCGKRQCQYCILVQSYASPSTHSFILQPQCGGGRVIKGSTLGRQQLSLMLQTAQPVKMREASPLEENRLWSRNSLRVVSCKMLWKPGWTFWLIQYYLLGP